MKLRRLEFIVIGVTLAFACFIGGFFTGRNWSAVNIVSVAAQNEAIDQGITVQSPGISEQPGQENPAGSGAATNTTASPAEIAQTPQENNNPGAAQEMPGAPRNSDGKININIASQSELTDLPGIGNVLASRIVDYRRQNGEFKRIEDLRNVSGIGEKRYEAIQDKITVG